MPTRTSYLRRLPSELPKSPDITDLLRANMIRHMPRSMGAADKRREAERILAWAQAEGDGIRRRQRRTKIDQLRAEVKLLGQRGRYPKHLWTKLRDYEAAQAEDFGGDLPRAD